MDGQRSRIAFHLATLYVCVFKPSGDLEWMHLNQVAKTNL